MTYQRTRIVLPGETSKRQESLSGTFDTVVNAIGSVVSGATASFLKLAAPHYKMMSGVAKATDQATLDLFKALQTQCNRVAKMKNFAVIGIDGAIGGDTKASMIAVNTAAAADYNAWSKLYTSDQIKPIADLIALPTTPEGIAANAIPYYALVKGYADKLSAPPAVASPPPVKPPTYIDIATNKEVGQGMGASALDAWKRMGTGGQLAAVGVLGIAAVWVAKGHKKGRR